MSREHLAQLKMARQSPALQPRAVWVSETRAKLAREARASVASPATAPDITMIDRLSVLSRMFLPAQVWQTARALGVFFLAGTVAVGGWIMGASASQDSLPGEPLYGVKLAMEKTEVAVADVVSSPKVVAAKELDFAARRAAEAKKSQLSEQKAVALESLQQTIESANKRLEKVVQQSPEQAVEVAKVVSEKTDQILDTLHETTVSVASVNTVITPSTTAANIALSAQVQETEQLVEKASVQAVQVLIEKGSSTDVKETVEKKLEKMATDMADIAKQAATVIATSSTLPIGPSTTAAPVVSTTIPTPSASSTTSTVPAVNAVSVPAQSIASPQTVPVTTSTIQLPDVKQVEVTIDEAKTLLNGNNLQGALEKVKELYDIKNEAKSAVIQIDIAKSVGATVVPTVTATGTIPVSVQIVTPTVQTSTVTGTVPAKEPVSGSVPSVPQSTSTVSQPSAGVAKTP